MQLLTIAVLATLALADWSGNINYGSPSLRHEGFGIDLPKVIKRHSSPAYTKASALHFTHGVASGDPYPNSVILWTRVSPQLDNDGSNVTVSGYVPLYNHDTEQYVKASKDPICVTYSVYSDCNLTTIVSGGVAYTSSDIDYTVKVEALGLQPFTQYWYQFAVCGSSIKSRVGQTKTIPRPGDDVAKVRLAIYSCSNFPLGFFNAYGNPVRKDSVDYIVHLGDYIYESNNSVTARPVEPRRAIFTLYDFRKRIATYRTDQDLALSHRMFPWIPVWDDHEVSDNGYRDRSSVLNNTEDSFLKDGRVSVDQRKMNAVRAYFEWMPLRQVDMDNNLRIWRSFQIGSLMDLIMLDTRNYDRSITDMYWNTEYVTEIINDAGRTLMGSLQENWFYKTLFKSKQRGATWRVIGSQVIFSRVNISDWFGSIKEPYNTDQWDGYQANRNRTFQTLYDHNINNNIMLAGDSHANWATDLVWLDHANYSPITGAGSVGVEFAGTSVSSAGFGANWTQAQCNNQSNFLVQDNVELQWQERYYRGYYELHISKENVLAQYFGCPSLLKRNGYEVSLANFSVVNGDNRLARPVGGGRVEMGVLQRGQATITNLTHDTSTGQWFIGNFSRITIAPGT